MLCQNGHQQSLQRHEIVCYCGRDTLNEGFCDLLWYMCTILHPMHCLLRQPDMEIEGTDKDKSAISPQSIDKVSDGLNSDSCPALKLKIAYDRDLDFYIPNAIGELLTFYFIQHHSLKVLLFL